MFSYDTQVSLFELKDFDKSLNSQIPITFSLCSCSKLVM